MEILEARLISQIWETLQSVILETRVHKPRKPVMLTGKIREKEYGISIETLVVDQTLERLIYLTQTPALNRKSI